MDGATRQSEGPAYDDLLAHLEDYERLRKAARAVVEGRWGPHLHPTGPHTSDALCEHVDALLLVALADQLAGAQSPE